jgi:hypothetical protein
MKHISEEELVLHYYGDTPNAAVIEEHLKGCAECRANLESLNMLLETVDRAVVPERAASYAEEVWRQLVPQLARERLGEDTSPYKRLLNLQFPRWALASGFALLLLGAFLAGRLFPSRTGEGNIVKSMLKQELQQAPISEQARQRILFREIGDHLERTQLALIELINTKTNGIVDISEEQALAQQLVQVNRLYRRNAVRMGENAVAVVLDDLERTLIEIANSPSQLSEMQVDDLQQRFAEEDLLFKVKVLADLVRTKEMETARNLSGG